MIKTLFIIAGAGVVLATGSLVGAATLAGGDLRHNDWTWSVVEMTSAATTSGCSAAEASPR